MMQTKILYQVLLASRGTHPTLHAVQVILTMIQKPAKPSVKTIQHASMQVISQLLAISLLTM